MKPPQGFGWAPHRHFRAILGRNGREVPVIIRACWSVSGFESERHLYESVLGQFPFVTPRLLASFSLKDGEVPWMVLQDIGEPAAQKAKPEDRRAFLQALGQLHGCSFTLLASAQLPRGPLPCFPESHAYTYYHE